MMLSRTTSCSMSMYPKFTHLGPGGSIPWTTRAISICVKDKMDNGRVMCKAVQGPGVSLRCLLSLTYTAQLWFDIDHVFVFLNSLFLTRSRATVIDCVKYMFRSFLDVCSRCQQIAPEM